MASPVCTLQLRKICLLLSKLYHRHIRFVAADRQDLARPVAVFGSAFCGDVGEFWPFGAAFVLEVFFVLAGVFGGDALHQGFEAM